MASSNRAFALGLPAPTTGSIVPPARATGGLTPGQALIDHSADKAAEVHGVSHANGLSVDLILTGSDRSVALVNGRFVEVGSEVGDLRVVTIDPEGVILRSRAGASILVPVASSGVARRGRGTPGLSQP